MADNSTRTGDASNNDPTEQELLDAVMANSDFAKEAGITQAPPLPDEEIEYVDPDESDEDPTEEAVSEDEEEEVNEYVDEEQDADDESTQDAGAYTTDDLDLDAMLAVKIDGEEVEVSFGDLVKGYTTEQSLTKKGRELGEARKALETERAEKMEALETASQASAQMLASTEERFAKEYHDIEAKIQKARDEDDTYTVNELKDKREQAQSRYWSARQNREGLLKKVEEQKQAAQAEQWKEQLDHFAKVIPDMIPDFDAKMASSIREFAIDEGIAAEVLDTITDPAVIKFVDDYRRLKQGVSKGTAKRKAVPAKKALPTKKPQTKQRKQANQEQSIRARGLKEDASEEDRMAFLRQHASKSLNL